MKPFDFLSEVVEAKWAMEDAALTSAVEIHSANNEWEILSYYYNPDKGCMVLDIEKKES